MTIFSRTNNFRQIIAKNDKVLKKTYELDDSVAVAAERLMAYVRRNTHVFKKTYDPSLLINSSLMLN